MKQIKIADKYLAREFIKPFIVTLLGIIVVFISGYLLQLFDYIIYRNIAVDIVLQLLLYRLPEMIVESIGLATLFATLLTLTQMVKNNEYVALRMGGINFFRFLTPLLVLALMISGFAFFLNESVVPRANSNYQNIIRYDIRQQAERGVYNNLFFRDYNNRYIYIGEADDEQASLERILIKDDDSDRLITASNASFESEVLYLSAGQKYRLDDRGNLQDQENFNQLEVNLGRKLSDFYEQEENPAEMNRSELKERIELFQRGGFDTRSLWIRYHINLSQALVPLIFVIIGAPLSVKSKKGRVFGVITSVLLLFVYYIFFSASRFLGLNGYLPPLMAAWFANLFFAVIGISLILQEDGVFNFVGEGGEGY